ncbi:VOC family protein [Microbacterium sp.]|uniref:VOC family protein n=1 Tax=Microbacterium sp. TaxID=51671 RepID=UPI003A86CE6F
MTALDHVGVSVGDLDAQAAWYVGALGLLALPPTVKPDAGMRTQFLVDPVDGWALELLERQGSQPQVRAQSPADSMRVHGYGHLCLRVDDVATHYAALVAAGAGEITPPGPSPMSGLPVAFVADPEGNLIELIQRPAPLSRATCPTRPDRETTAA